MRASIGSVSVTRVDTLEQLSMQSLPVSPLRRSLWDGLTITQDWRTSLFNRYGLCQFIWGSNKGLTRLKILLGEWGGGTWLSGVSILL